MAINNAINPYQILTNWLFDRNINSPLPNEVIENKISGKHFLLQFLKVKDIVLFCNKYLNNIDIFTLPDDVIFYTLKQLCIKTSTDKTKMLFIPRKKIDKTDLISKIKSKLVYLKTDEIEYLISNYSDTQEYQLLMESLGLNDTTKKEKVKKIAKYKFTDIVNEFKDIKSSDNCKKCLLNNNPLVLFDTNNKSDVSNIDILFVAEAPGATEVEKNVPLIGRSGQKLRQFIKEYISPTKYTWFMTNTCLCRPINNETPNQDMIASCNGNLLSVVNKLNPKVIVMLGSTALSAFGFSGKISALNGQLLEKDNRKYLPLLHPSAIIRNAFPESYYHKGFQNLINILSNQNTSNTVVDQTLETIIMEDEFNSDNIVDNENSNSDIMQNNHFLKYPKEWLEDYYLVDVYSHNEEVYYILKSKKDDSKIIKQYPFKENFYYWKSNKNDIIMNMKDCALVTCNYKQFKQEQINNAITYYESDVQLSLKHTLEYFRQSSTQDTYIPSIMFLDIEVYTGKYKGFPFADEALYPISAITCMLGDTTRTSLLVPENLINEPDSKILDMIYNKKCSVELQQVLDSYKGKLDITLYRSEKTMLSKFCDYIQKECPDIITAWNVSFDIGYIYNRLDRLSMNPNKISPKNYAMVNVQDNYISVNGLVVLDMLSLYKGFTFGAKESYSLSFIAKEELGDDKINYEENLNHLYETDLQKFILYNIKDVDLIKRIQEKLKHIDLLNMLRQVCKTTWDKALSVSYSIDNLFIDRLHNKQTVCRNFSKSYNMSNEKVPGAYVKSPKGGLYKYVIDLDFTSLYPNIMRTYNIGPETLIGAIDEAVALDYLYSDIETFKNKYTKIDIKINLYTDPRTITKSISEFLIWSKNKIVTVCGVIYKSHEDTKSFTFEIIDDLIVSRKKYKKMMLDAIEQKDNIRRNTYYNYQYALKVVANSIYGTLGFDSVRWYNYYMAKSITLSGREASKFSALYCDQYIDLQKEKKPISIDNNKIKQKFLSDYHNDDIDTKYVIYMDTDSLFVNLESLIDKNKTQDEIVNDVLSDIVPNLQTYINKECIQTQLVNNIHSIKSENNFLNLKQEILAKSAYFIENTKKKYATYIINKEGKSVNEMDIKGLDTQRSDYPSATKEKLRKLLDIILLEDKLNISKIQKFINETETEFRTILQNHSIQLSKAASFTKDIKKYKNMPQHIKSMLLWNMLEYKYFIPGTKGYLFKLKGIDLNLAPKNVFENYHTNISEISKLKLDAICLPIDQKELPNYYIVDMEHMMGFCWTERINLLLGDMIKIHQQKMDNRMIATF